MAKVRLTAGRIRDFSLPEGAQQAFLWDELVPQLAVRVTRGTKAFVFESRLGAKLRITIGAISTWGIDAARDEARRLQAMVDQGIDPRQAKADRIAAAETRRKAVEAQQQEQDRQQATVAEAWSAYLEARRPRWGEAHYRDHVKLARLPGTVHSRGTTNAGPLAGLMSLKLADLSPAVLAAWLDSETTIRTAQTGLAYRLFRAFLNWCNEQPEFGGLVDPAGLLSRTVRERVPAQGVHNDCLQREQLPAWFAAVHQIGNPVISAYLQGLLLTGARREELAGLTWDVLDFQWQSLTIRDKVEGERTIPLTPYLAALLAALPRRNQWVFSSPAAESGRLQDPNPAHNRACQIAGLPPMTLHGLRRSFGTLAEWVEVPVGVVAQIMGHKPSATAEKHYRVRPLDLLRKWHTALESWVLNEAGILFVEQARPGLRIVKGNE